ncbi:heat shock protein GrpE [Rhodobacteraceae bacterium THAF1]|uniref:nucleotide exchange factor GrpE n=1 Tax=Palleronia sp. THAF1 TaxID=2587842 RepID=UPI000F3B3091|nr:nucleotide exchange factor GrpE [Palleronia sp. THAF1]QFU10167.1 heat shock protein GrpE [Palleronia sp. THAF1]VDC16928.1 heat shock protein GrpE [Rhodobacteraceae bacterium THAF1]
MSDENERDIQAAIDEMLKGEDDAGVSAADKVKRKSAPRTGDEEFDLDALANGDDIPEIGETDGIAAEVEQLRAENNELKDRFVRALADAENSRKRADRERREAENYGGSKMARDMLPVYDNLQRAMEAIPEENREANASLIEGMELTLRELQNVFSKHGVEVVAPQVGDRFDPKIHEAMFEAPVPNTVKGDIIQVMTVGFMIHDRLLRAAQVGVSATPKA